MSPYEQCWCGSGTKYKWCHFRREQQTQINVFEIEAEMLVKFRDGYCSHPDPTDDPCSEIITKAHTIQKKGGLTAIAEAGHVLTVKPTMKEMIKTEGQPEPRKVGINNASVFPGFCSRHDTVLFKEIEGKSLSLTKDTAFLFSYRAIAYERFAKAAQLETIKVQRQADRGRPFATQAAIQIYLASLIAGLKAGMRDVDAWKQNFDERLLSGLRDDFHFLAVRFEGILPVVACGAFHPQYDFHGNLLQQLGREGNNFDHITLTVTTFEGQTIFVLGWIGSDDSQAKALADSYIAVDNARKADALVRLLFIHTENLFLRPSWWDALPLADKQVLNRLTKSGTTMQMRSASEIMDDTHSFVSAKVVEVVSD